MGSRFIVSGTQFGILISFIREKDYDRAQKYIQELIDTQYLGTAEETKKFIKEFKKKK